MTLVQNQDGKTAPSEANASIPSIRRLTSAELRRLVLGGGEVAVVDVREGERYATGHVSVSSELPFSEIEARAQALLPRFGLPVIVTDDDGKSLAPAAARRLIELGYRDVRILEGGLNAWKDAGGELLTGVYSLSKALGEFVERHYHTPRIKAEELKRRLEAEPETVVLDTRPVEEFNYISIPTGVAAPGAELLYRVFDAIKSPTTPIVVNCAGRTRGIIGAQALINAGLPNPIVSLENGTAAWWLAGFEPGRGETQEAARPSAAGLEQARAAAAKVARRFGVKTIGKARLDEFRAQSAERSLYLFDVRTTEEYEAGHLPQARSAPGGQLVQATDTYVGTRQGRIVLVDDADLVRATITASWLIQLGLDDVHVYPASPEELSQPGPEPKPYFDAPAAATLVTAAELRKLISSEGAAVIDLEGAPPYFRQRRYIPGSFVGRRSTLGSHLGRIPGNGPIVLTSLDGYVARLAAAELSQTSKRKILALAGGTEAWIAAGFETSTGLDQPSFTPDETLPPVPTLEVRRKTLAAYVHWGDVITDQIERDGLVKFRAFETSENHA